MSKSEISKVLQIQQKEKSLIYVRHDFVLWSVFYCHLVLTWNIKECVFQIWNSDSFQGSIYSQQSDFKKIWSHLLYFHHIRIILDVVFFKQNFVFNNDIVNKKYKFFYISEAVLSSPLINDKTCFYQLFKTTSFSRLIVKRPSTAFRCT